MPITTLEPTSSHKRLRLYSLIAAVLAVLQLLLAGVFLATKNDAWTQVHLVVGVLTLVAAAAAAVAARVWGRLSGQKGLFPHAAGVAGACLVQLVLGFAGAPDAAPRWIIGAHMVLGLLILAGAVALYALARRTPAVMSADASGR